MGKSRQGTNHDSDIKEKVGVDRQGCALRKITRSLKVPNHEIQGAQHKVYMKKVSLSGCNSKS